MPASKAQRAATAARRAQLIALKMAGLTLDQIADQLGYSSRAAASKDLARALESAVEAQHTNAELLVAEELMRLNRLQAGLWPAATAGDPRAATVVLRVIEMRMDLLQVRKRSDEVGLASSVIGSIAAGLGVLDARLRAEGAYDALPDNAD